MEIRRKNVKDPNDVRSIGLTVSDATRSTKNKRSPVDWGKPPERTPWVTDGRVDRNPYRDLVPVRYWEVWLNIDIDRIWLKQSRWGR